MTDAQFGGMDAVLQKRFDHEEDRDEGASTLTASETMRSASESTKAEHHPAAEERISLFWRVFGGTLLSIAALVVITIYNGMSTSISELRTELYRERDARAELIKKDEFNTRTTNIYERIRALDNQKAEQEALKERINGNAAMVDALKKDGAAAIEAFKKDFAATNDIVKKDAAALEVLKERITTLEGVKKEIAGIDLLKEKLGGAAADLRSIRDDMTKLQQEVERNKAGDNERKLARDSQYKQVEESLKELQKGLQACREKLARLEGSRPGSTPRDKSESTESEGASSPGKPIPPRH